jgi:hypothetical protein
MEPDQTCEAIAVILKHFYLYLNLDEYPDELTTPFGFQTRYICNFIERHLRPVKFDADGFSKICIQGRKKATGKSRIEGENALVVETEFDQERYQALTTEEDYSEFFLSMIEAGIKKGAAPHILPVKTLMAALDSFRLSGYRNCWVHKTKRICDRRLVAALECELDMSSFSLNVVVRRGQEVVFRERILETKPDELIFQHQFKDIVKIEDDLVVTNKFGKEVWRMSLKSIDAD